MGILKEATRDRRGLCRRCVKSNCGCLGNAQGVLDEALQVHGNCYASGNVQGLHMKCMSRVNVLLGAAQEASWTSLVAV
eukprot:8724605-Pyramimonas_sp.AAC.1